MQKTKISRTMEWLKLPKKVQKNHAKNLLFVGVDYLQYTCYDIMQALRALYNLGFSWEIDMDNSNVEYNVNYNLALTHSDTNMGHAYMLSFLSPWFPPIPIGSVEVYNPWQVLTLGTQGKIVFYGAYFVFQDIIKEEAPEVVSFANAVEFGTVVQTQKDKKPIYKCTRVDVAVDAKVSVSKKWMSHYIRPHKTSRHVPKPYNYQPELGGWQSIGYIPRLGRGIGIRVYNKILDIKSKKKEAWYPEYGNGKNPIVTRMEIVYSWDIATKPVNELIEYTKFRLLGDSNITAIYQDKRPKSLYSPNSAYIYFERYSQNHGKRLIDVLTDVVKIWTLNEYSMDEK